MGTTTIGTSDVEVERMPGWRVAFLPGNPMAPFLIGMIAFTLLGLVAMVVLWASPVAGWIVAAVGAVAGAMLVCTLVIWPFSHVTGNRMLAVYRHGAWATWDIGSDEWRTHAKRENKSAMRQTLSSIAFILVAVSIGFWIGGYEDAETRTLSYWLIGISAGLVAIGGIAAVIVQKRRWSRPISGRDVQVKFTFDGYLADGHYTTLRGYGTRIEGVQVQPGTSDEPTTLAFDISTASRYGRQYRTVRVPVPAGKEAEAEAIAERYLSGAV